MKIRTQLLIFILSVVLIGFALITLLSYTFSRSIVLSEAYERAENQKIRYQEFLNGYFENMAKVAGGMAYAVTVQDEISEDFLHKLLKQNLLWNAEIYGTTIFVEPAKEEIGKKLFAPYYYRKGHLLKYVPAEPDFPFEKQIWYSLPKQNGQALWTDPYFDIGASAIMTTYSVPIHRQGKFYGLATVDIDLSKLSKQIDAIQIGKNGYALLVSKNGTFLTHPESENYVLKQDIKTVAKKSGNLKFKEIVNRMLKGKLGPSSVIDPFTGKQSWMTYSLIPSTGYILIIFIPEPELLENVINLSRNILWISMFTSFVIIIALVLISGRIARPIRNLSQTAQKIAEGNLDAEIPTLLSHDEVGQLGHDLKLMVIRIKEILKNVEDEKEKFERVFASMSDGIIATNANWKVTNINTAAERMLDVPVNANFIAHVSEKFKCNFELQDLLDYKKKDKRLEIVSHETEQVKEMIYSAMINSIVDMHDNISAHVITVRDITADRREELNKSTLLSLISHKIMTPITVLLTAASFFSDGTLGTLTKNQKDYIEKMVKHANKVKKLVNRLIHYVSITEGKEGLEKEEIDLKNALEGFTKNFAADCEKEVEFTLDVVQQSEKIFVNRKHLNWILEEIIDNASKFNEKAKVAIKIAAQKTKKEIKFSISDNGIGIPNIYHDKIFERFFQVDKYFTGNTEGMGLGLALVKTILDRLEGHIGVASHEGSGSTFTFSIPA